MKVTVSYRVSIKAPAKTTSLWLPLPSDADYQEVTAIRHQGTSSEVALFTEFEYGTPVLYAYWSVPSDHREITLSMDAEMRARDFDLGASSAMAALPDAVRMFLRPTAHIPTDGIVKRYADQIVHGATSAVAKVRAIYDWVIEHTYRNNAAELCGLGDVKSMLESGQLCGKCVDINSLFVALARAAGIPAREVYGIRVADSRLAPPLGQSGDITTAQHCKSEVYLADYGWVPVDPADVAKAIDEKLPAEEVQKIRAHLIGHSEANWLAFNHGRDFMLNPPQSGPPLNYFMYPYCEVDRKRISADGDQFAYEITSVVQGA